MQIIYDDETFPNVFLVTFLIRHTGRWATFEISDWCDDWFALRQYLHALREHQIECVGFNNIGFDMSLLQMIYNSTSRVTAIELYTKAQEIIRSRDEDGDQWAAWVRPTDRFAPQIDLYLINHFNNKARMTGLKALEIAMRMDNVEDLPFPVGTVLTRDQVAVLRRYNLHDCRATAMFLDRCEEAVSMRRALTAQYGIDLMNKSDASIGSEIFRVNLEAAGIPVYEYGPEGRKPLQTVRDQIELHRCVPSYVRFDHPEFNRVKDWLAAQVITETKGVFKDLSARAYGLEFVFGTGGLHASVENSIYTANDEWMIIDADVTAMYPSIAIANRYFPEHLTQKFCDVYADLRAQRQRHKKGTVENAALKIALNASYGNSNNKFSFFYDPLFTMSITITGQLCLAMLAEMLHSFGTIIQVNTDGITMRIRRSSEPAFRAACARWEKIVGLTLEFAEYDTMGIRDVNNYIAVSTGKVKRKGAYEHAVLWHQDPSALVVPKVVEQVLLHGKDIAETVRRWPDPYDFHMRIKVPRSSKLMCSVEGQEFLLPNTTRYYVSKGGVTLTKVMPPLKGSTEWRRIGVCAGYTVCPINDIAAATLPIDFDFYINEVEKLVLPLQVKE